MGGTGFEPVTCRVQTKIWGFSFAFVQFKSFANTFVLQRLTGVPTKQVSDGFGRFNRVVSTLLARMKNNFASPFCTAQVKPVG